MKYIMIILKVSDKFSFFISLCKNVYVLGTYCWKLLIKMVLINTFIIFLTLLLLNMTCPVLANSVDPDQLDSEDAHWSGSALFDIKYVNFQQKPDQVIWVLEIRSGRGILIYSAWHGLSQTWINYPRIIIKHSKLTSLFLFHPSK